MIALMGMLALSIDVGYMMTVRTELQRATDAAALAGAGVLIEGPDAAQLESLDFLLRNPVGSRHVRGDENRPAIITAWLQEHPGDFEFDAGHWDPDTRTFTVSSDLPSTIRVRTAYRNAPLFFARVFGLEDFDVRAESIARYQPRDIALVLDFSASMNDDSELKRIAQYGESQRQVVEDNLFQIYQELNPAYGELQFEPQYLTLEGQPASGFIPHIQVTFRADDLWIESTKDLSNVVMEFSDGTREKQEGLSGTTGAFRGSGYNYYKDIVRVWVKSGPNDSGEGPGYGERFDGDYAAIRTAFGLDGVAYPYPSGSWNDYLYYCRSNGNVRDAGYKKKYGYMTLINYWLEQKPTHAQTPDLWMASAQPVTALKDSVGVFMEYIQEVDCDDRVGLVIYNSPSQTALTENSLTEDFDAIESVVRHRQAGHYDNYTNIGAGIHYAWNELDANARPGARKMIVLMTDGIANRPGNTSTARAYALEQAAIAAEKRYPVVTISLGSEADTALMAEIAQITEGVHFNVPGGESVWDYEAQLLSVFRKIADDRPLVLVK